MSCAKCISLMQLGKDLSYMSESFFISTLIRLCGRFKQVHPDVCAGVVQEQAPILRKVVKTMTVSGRDGHLLCAAVLNSCPYPEVDHWDVPFPKPKPINIPAPQQSASTDKTFTVLQLSDWHVDPEYEAGADALCDKPICCRASNTDYSNVTMPASIWGAYTCDTPLTLIESMLEFIPTVAPDLAFGLLTGDIPSHEVWSTLPALKTQLVEEHSFALMHAHFDSPHLINSVLYPAVGNHESAPTNIFPLKQSRIPIEEEKDYLRLEWMYASLAKSWLGWLTPNTVLQVEQNSGSYVVYPRPGLKLISLNTNFCYTMNWWLYEGNAQQKDPDGILDWLINQLQASEDIGEKVWITGHIAPGDVTCLHDYSNYFHQIVERYSPHVITGQFYGHTHKDEYQVFYRDGNQTADNAISVGYVAPSVTPFANTNPAFRLYQVNAETFEVMDSITYVADLDQADQWITGPNWRVEYSAREAYQSEYAPLSNSSPLTAGWWHNVSVSMEEDPETMFAKYWKYRVKSAPLMRECDEACRSAAICAIRAGKSEQRCDYDPDTLPPFGDETVYKKSNAHRIEEIDSCGLNLVGQRHRMMQHDALFQENV
ncbi:sphingomyelin phosphodiesterase [Lichtheimia hyalospora FSU 10163]|nr:sphingomyelin phosphodiesterase [Lichtheimia hyalospora FSU 10163]